MFPNSKYLEKFFVEVVRKRFEFLCHFLRPDIEVIYLYLFTQTLALRSAELLASGTGEVDLHLRIVESNHFLIIRAKANE